MTTTTHKINRAFHLARRDGFLEKASDVFFYNCLKTDSAAKQFYFVHVVQYYLHSALHHAVLASKAPKAQQEEECLIRFIRFILGYLDSTCMIMESENEFNRPDPLLIKFLRQADTDDTASETNFNKSSIHLLEDISSLLKIVKSVLPEMRQTMLDKMNNTDKSRYNKAYQSLLKHTVTKTHKTHKSSLCVQISSPSPSRKYGLM
jgi:hypothetical protein